MVVPLAEIPLARRACKTFILDQNVRSILARSAEIYVLIEKGTKMGNRELIGPKICVGARYRRI